jgi:hypothetical protein
MRPKRRPLKLSRETLRRLNGDLSSVAGGTIIPIDVITKTIKTALTECPSCALTCAFTCSIDPASACLPDGCSLRCPPR